MCRLDVVIPLAFLACAAAPAPQLGAQSVPEGTAAEAKSTIEVPPWTTVPVALTRPVLSKTAHTGDTIYAETVFPVAVHDRMAIPAGSYVEGQIDEMTPPSWRSPWAHFLIHFTKLIFASGYTVAIFDAEGNAAAAPRSGATVASPPVSLAEDVYRAVANAYVEVTSANDVLLDNGSQIEMIFQRPLRLDGPKVAAAVRDAPPASIPHFQSATRCRPTPATEGTSDTVIPGTSGMPGTPDIVIPGAPGTPDTVIPGIPATQGTPATVIPGTPGTPGTACPGPPVAVPDPKSQTYMESFEISAPVEVAGKSLPAGAYQATWEGLGSTATVNLMQKKKAVAKADARIVLLNGKKPTGQVGTRANPDGSVSLRSLRFAGQSFALYFLNGTS